MGSYVSPGGYVREIDWSLYARSLSSTSVGFIGAFDKGPINEATLITNVDELVNVFGTPNLNTYAWDAIKQYLRSGRRAWVVRVADDDAAKAKIDVNSENQYGFILSSNKNLFTFDPPYAGTLKGSEVETYIINSYDALKFKVDGSDIVAVNLTSGIKSAQAIVNEINSQTTGITAVYNNGYVWVKSNTIGSSSSIEAMAVDCVRLDVESVSGDFTIGETITGGTSGATGVLYATDNSTYMDLHSVTGTFSPSETVTGGTSSETADITAAGVHERTDANSTLGFTTGTVYTGSDGNNTLNVSIDGGGTQTFKMIPDTANETISKTAQQVVNTINASISGGKAYKTYDGSVKIVTDTIGSSGSVQVLSSSTADTVLGFDNNVHSGNDSAAKCFSVEAINEGVWGNKISLMISTGTRTNTFRLAVIYDSKTVEVFNNLSKVQTSSDYFVNKINGVSRYITVTDNTVETNMPAFDTYTLVGGNSGISSLNDADYIGINTGSTKTGLQIFRNAEKLQINLLAIPGISSAAVISEMLSLCEDRADCMAVVDPPRGLTPQTVVDWHNGEGIWSGSHTAFNSSYGALYWPWVKVYDSYNEIEKWVPPSGFALDRMAYTDKIAEEWYAPAGFTRGRLTNVLGLEYDTSQGDRDYMYSDGNAVNPIVDFTQEGVVIWGQRTLQRKPTALDRVNVRRLLLYIRKVVATTTKYFVFEPNDKLSWARLRNALIPYFDWLYDPETGRALYYYKIQCDKTTNTDLDINNGVMRVKIFLQPVKAAEIIVSDLILLPTGVTAEDYVIS